MLRSGKKKHRESLRGWKRVFFATDIHGSEQCFRKFLNAGKFYDAKFLVLGGDILGKLLVPVIQHPNGTFSAQYGDMRLENADRQEADNLMQIIRRFGHYPAMGTQEELAQLEDETFRERRFRELAYKSVEEWVALAEERLKGTGIRMFMAPGNDDFLEIDEVLEASEFVEFAEGKRIELDSVHEMITTGYSNPTPWKTERELPEGDLARKLELMGDQVKEPANLVAVIHPPPYGTTIDQAPRLDEEFNMSLSGGGVEMASVGSHAVREFVEATQPLVALCGHVHEAGGAYELGRTLCINPGSEYTQGVLAGSILELADEQVVAQQFVSG